jgi:hypothetical protein
MSRNKVSYLLSVSNCNENMENISKIKSIWYDVNLHHYAVPSYLMYGEISVHKSLQFI